MKFFKFFFLTTIFCVIFGIFLKYLLGYESIPNKVEIDNVENRAYDFVVVGAGTSGSVLAYELSKNSNDSVLLIEAGVNFNHLSVVPIFSTMMQGTFMDWGLKSVPQKYSSRGLENNQQSLPRGKGLGGSHQLNYMLHFSGIEGDFEEWAKVGAHEWNYQNMKPFLSKHDCNSAWSSCPDEHSNSTDLPVLKITDLKREESMLGNAFLAAGEELNKKFSLVRYTIENGKRHSVYHEFLRRAFKFSNLNILLNSQVIKIEFNSQKEATSLLVSSSGQKISRIYVKKEIILSGGAFHSPQILKLSGIGDQRELKQLGIDLVHHSPNVGENLFDHMNFPLFVSINQSASVTIGKILSYEEISKYFWRGEGIWATPAVVGTGNSEAADSGITLFGMGSADEITLKKIANFRTEVFRAFFPFYYNSSQEGFIFLSTCHQPKSRGSVKLNPENPLGDPLIDPNYLENYHDMKCIKTSIKLIVESLKTSKFRKLNARIHWPKLKECSNFGPFAPDFVTDEPSDRYLDCIIRMGALTSHHPGGTCAIGEQSDSVLDNQLRVRGVKRVRVVDGSILPLPVSGFPNSVILAMAERGAKILRGN